jgi:hypothetical protein
MMIDDKSLDVYLESEIIPNIPSRLKALHWHEDMFQIPQQAEGSLKIIILLVAVFETYPHANVVPSIDLVYSE